MSDETTWTPETWNWLSNTQPPFHHILAELPSGAPTNDGRPGRWGWSEEYETPPGEDEAVLVSRWPVWIVDPVKSPEEIAREYAEATLASAVASRAALNLDGVRAAIAKLDPAAIREPADGFDVLGVTVIGQSELNSTREGLADVAEALVAVMETLSGQSDALDQIIESASSTLAAIVTPASLMATAIYDGLAQATAEVRTD